MASSASAPLSSWPAARVAAWLASLGLPPAVEQRVAALARAHAWDGAALAALTRDDLPGVPRLWAHALLVHVRLLLLRPTGSASADGDLGAHIAATAELLAAHQAARDAADDALAESLRKALRDLEARLDERVDARLADWTGATPATHLDAAPATTGGQEEIHRLPATTSVPVKAATPALAKNGGDNDDDDDNSRSLGFLEGMFFGAGVALLAMYFAQR